MGRKGLVKEVRLTKVNWQAHERPASTFILGDKGSQFTVKVDGKMGDIHGFSSLT